MSFILFLMPSVLFADVPQSSAPLPEIHQLLREVEEHQKQLDKIRESYTYTSLQTQQDIDSEGKVTKTETEEHEAFFVNGHVIERTVKRNGRGPRRPRPEEGNRSRNQAG